MYSFINSIVNIHESKFNYFIYLIKEFVFCFFLFLLILIFTLLLVAFFTVFERKIMASVHQRVGPNRVGPFGLLQAIADGLKLFLKEFVLPLRTNRILFILSPIYVFFISAASWLFIPFGSSVVIINSNLGVLFFLLFSSLSVYGIILAGWSSNSRYSFLGSLRSTAQMISYELTMSVCVLTVILEVGTLNLTEIVEAQLDLQLWLGLPLLGSFIIFFICGLAELGRTPFDLPEAESELVSGYNTEHSAFPFALFYLAEYWNMVLFAHMVSIMFLGGWLAPGFLNIVFFEFLSSFWYFIKVFIVLFLLVLIRVTFPRYRYDQLMRLGWKVLLPVSLVFFCLSVFFNIIFVSPNIF